MSVDYEQQLLDNETAKKTAIDESNTAYDKTINDYKDEVDSQQQQLKDYEAAQKDLLQEQTDFAIDKINQQKEQAEKDYNKEQQAAYGDYKRQTNPYGANAEQMAALGLSRSGYSESSNVAMYTAYQNRVAAARASIEQAKLTFDNAIREAKLTNDINLAKIAQETLEKSLALSMESVIYLGNLEQEKAAAARSIDQTYYNRAQDIRDAQKESMESGLFSIDGDEGNADFTAIDAFFGDGISDDAVAQMIADGIITMETVNGVDVYKVADEEKAKAYTAGQTGATAQNGAEGTVGGGQTEQPKYNYSDERVNAYFEQKDAVEALQEEYDNAVFKLNALINQETAKTNPRYNYTPAYNSRGPLGTQKTQQQVAADLALNAQQEYVNRLSRQLRTASNKLENMPKPVESSVYLSRDAACKKTKEAWEQARRELSQLRGSGVSKGALSAAEEKVRNAKKAFDKAYAALMSAERYKISSSSGEGSSSSRGGLVGNQGYLR